MPAENQLPSCGVSASASTNLLGTHCMDVKGDIELFPIMYVNLERKQADTLWGPLSPWTTCLATFLQGQRSLRVQSRQFQTLFP